ncbi:MAG: glycoside hydrolase family 2 TIM barrel-domain containing protein, partial [Armatimonadota bacterium]|nr:glycoside hydrolase family 2 TIM barrel-domain containing protein [Armatimonadota bacterium]
MRRLPWWAYAAGMLLWACFPGVCAGRQQMNLSGEWQFQKVTELEYPPAGAWQTMAVPGYLTGTNYERAWFRREFVPPAEMQGQRVEIYFGGVKWNSVVYLNGRRVGSHFGGYEAFTVDVTDALRFGAPNELLVGVHDWTGVFIDRETDLSPDRIRGEVRGVPRDKILAPIGGMINVYGIWDEVFLRSHPAVYIRDYFVQPSVRRGELVVRVTVANASPAGAVVQVGGGVAGAAPTASRLLGAASASGGGPVLPARTATVAPGSEVTLILSAPWEKPRLWSHEDPFLYRLHLDLHLAPWTDGAPPADTLEVPFGFREFWTEGPDFYLNGHKVHLLATSWWPPRNWPSRDEIRSTLRAIKASHTFAFRTHTQPWPRVWYELADEEGVLMIPEGAVWNDDTAYRVDDPRFWENYADHLRGMVEQLKNHPSVVMWSLENEMYGSRMHDQAPAVKDLARMGQLVKRWDPTRPILYESDGDPGGVADVIGIHYPHEYPEFTQWPNEADWLQHPIRKPGAFLGNTDQFFWERKKPLYIGEFLWVPSSDPSWHTVFFGDEAYRDYEEYRRLAKGEAWRMQILGYRRHGVSGMSPWTMVEGGPLNETNPMYRAHVWAYRPLAAFLREYDRRFFAGERVKRTVDLFNDTLRGGEVEFHWRLMAGEKRVAGSEERLRMEPGDHTVRVIEVPAPRVNDRRSLTLVLEMRRDGKVLFQESYPFNIYPAPRLRTPRGTATFLYDPAGRTGPALARLGLRCQRVSSLQDLPATARLLVVGAGAFQPAVDAAPVIGASDPVSQQLERFVRAGGRLLVLEQAAYPRQLVSTSLTTHASTMTFPLAVGHAVLAGLSTEEFRFWRGDHRVSRAELARPRSGGGRALVVSGSQSGLDHAPLLEIPLGRGVMLLSQLLLVEKLDREPVASRLLQNCLEYLSSYRPAGGRTAVVASDPAFPEYLRSIGLRFDDLSGRLESADLAPYRLLVAQG